MGGWGFGFPKRIETILDLGVPRVHETTVPQLQLLIVPHRGLGSRVEHVVVHANHLLGPVGRHNGMRSKAQIRKKRLWFHPALDNVQEGADRIKPAIRHQALTSDPYGADGRKIGNVRPGKEIMSKHRGMKIPFLKVIRNVHHGK